MMDSAIDMFYATMLLFFQHCITLKLISLADIDECKMKLHRCDEMAKCYDTEGSYLCRCVKGYRSISVNHTGFHGQCKGELEFEKLKQH